MTRKCHNHRLKTILQHRDENTEHRQSQHNLSKAASCLFFRVMTANLENAPKTLPKNKDLSLKPRHIMGATTIHFANQILLFYKYHL